jgi:hypothetical protein
MRDLRGLLSVGSSELGIWIPRVDRAVVPVEMKPITPKIGKEETGRVRDKNEGKD